MLVKRNVLLFFRDKANVFFSLLAVLIILGLYILFLGDMMEQSLQQQIGFESDKISMIMASIMLGGMVAVTSVTGCLGAIGVSVEDKQNVANDFLTSPAPRWKITMGYVIGSAIVGLIMTFFALVISLIYIISQGSSFSDITNILRLLLTVLLSVMCGNAMVYFFSMFIKTQNAFASVSTVIGTLIGFLMGIYIPIGQFPNYVQWIIKCFPMSHAASMFRQVLVDDELTAFFADAPPELLQSFRELFGIIFNYGEFTSGFWFSALVLVVTTIVFYALSLLVIKMR